jgi:hypothetical protein
MLRFDQRYSHITVSNPIEKYDHGHGGCRHPFENWHVVI